MQIELSDMAIGGAVAAVDYAIGKAPITTNSTIDVIIQIIKFGLSFFLRGRGMRSFILIFTMMLGTFTFSSCSNEQVKEVKKVSAIGLAQGLSDLLQANNGMLCDSPILECERPDLVQEYFAVKTCEALNIDCGLTQKSMMKGIIARFACKAAVKVVMPAIMPSKQLPRYLKEKAGCKASCLDMLASDQLPKLCEKL